jgi:hypothetical protein
MHPTLNIAIKAAREAAKIINRASLDIDKLKIDVKRQSDFVTEVDRAAEAAILNVLRDAYPAHGILAEESGLAGTSAESEYQWIIDPLDGTTNFIHGLPQYHTPDDAAVPAPQGAAPDLLLFYRMGDFYELFYEDAERPRACSTSPDHARPVGRPADPMAGVPYHASSNTWRGW